MNDAAGSEAASRLDEVTSALEGLRAVLATPEDVDRVLKRLADTVVRVVPDADEVSVTVLSDGKARTAAATNEHIVAVDEDQYRAGEGPCLEAAKTGKPLRVTIETARSRWPAFTAAAERAGVLAYLSAPLVLSEDDDSLIGALNVYGYQANAFDPFDEALLRLFTTTASAAITNADRYQRSAKLAEQLSNALTSRAEIDQAKGVLMAVHRISADEAFNRLVRESQHTNTKLYDVAVRLLASITGPND